MTPEAKARQQIDQKLEQAGWVVQDMKRLNLSAGPGVAVREYPTDTGPVRNCWNASSPNAAPAGKPSNSPNSRSKAKPRPKIGKRNILNQSSPIPRSCRNCRRGGYGRVYPKRAGWTEVDQRIDQEMPHIFMVAHIPLYRRAIFVMRILLSPVLGQHIVRLD